jgi:hypothetical protein
MSKSQNWWLVRVSKMNPEESETEPLLPQTTTITVPKKSKKLLVAGIISSILLIGYFLVYFVYLPPKIQEAIEGNGSDIRHVRLLDVNPVRFDLSVRIPVEPLPISVHVNVGKMVIGQLTNTGTKTIGMFQFPPIAGRPGDDHMWANNTIEIQDLDVASVSWYLKQAIKYGLKKTEISL